MATLEKRRADLAEARRRVEAHFVPCPTCGQEPPGRLTLNLRLGFAESNLLTDERNEAASIVAQVMQVFRSLGPPESS